MPIRKMNRLHLIIILTIISTSRKGLNMVYLVPIKETNTDVQAHPQGYSNNPI